MITCGFIITRYILRVQDIDYKLKTITVRSGKGAKDRITTFPSSITPFLEEHLSKVRHIHENDLAQGYGEVYMPYALIRKYAKGAKEWAWQYVFPSTTMNLYPCPRTGGHGVPSPLDDLDC